jgi:hypothetical protein
VTAKAIFWSALAVVVCIIVPVCMAVTVWQQVRTKKRGDRRSGPSGGASVGNAMQDLDRLVARPSIEYTIEAETSILKRGDNQGGH